MQSRLGLFLHFSRIEERRQRKIVNRRNVVQVEAAHIDRRHSRSGERIIPSTRSNGSGSVSRRRGGNRSRSGGRSIAVFRRAHVLFHLHRSRCPLRRLYFANLFAALVERAFDVLLDDSVRFCEMTGALAHRRVKSARVARPLHGLVGRAGLFRLLLRLLEPIRHAAARMVGLALQDRRCCNGGICCGNRRTRRLFEDFSRPLRGFSIGKSGLHRFSRKRTERFARLIVERPDILGCRRSHGRLLHLHKVLRYVHRCRPAHRFPRKRSDGRFRSSKARFGSLRGDFRRSHVRRFVHELRALGNKPGTTRGIGTVNLRVATCSQFGLAHTASANTTGHLQEHRHAGSVAVRALVVRGQLMKQRHHKRHCDRDQRDDGQHVQRHVQRAFGIRKRNGAHDQQNRQKHHGAERRPLQDRQRWEKRAGKFRPNLARVVTRHEDHLAPPRSTRLSGIARFVFGNDVLAHAARERFRQQRTVEHLGCKQSRSNEGHHDSGHAKHRHKQRCQRKDEGEGTAHDLWGFRARRAIEILDDGRKPGILLHLLGNVQRRLLFLFGSRRARPDFLGQIRDVIHWFRHIACLSLAILQGIHTASIRYLISVPK